MTIKEVCQKYGISRDTLRYYEKSGMIPEVPRTSGGIRNYGEEELLWIELALCMRRAGLPVAVMAEYLKLFRQGDSTIPDRLQLLTEQRDNLLRQRDQISEIIARLDYKIGRYREALETGHLHWERKFPEGNRNGA
ncbi:MAG: MerR family transcriptional regulator [bacterium]|nr:MerR family transcriptional regulator [bacterium]